MSIHDWRRYVFCLLETNEQFYMQEIWEEVEPMLHGKGRGLIVSYIHNLVAAGIVKTIKNDDKRPKYQLDKNMFSDEFTSKLFENWSN